MKKLILIGYCISLDKCAKAWNNGFRSAIIHYQTVKQGGFFTKVFFTMTAGMRLFPAE